MWPPEYDDSCYASDNQAHPKASVKFVHVVVVDPLCGMRQGIRQKQGYRKADNQQGVPNPPWSVGDKVTLLFSVIKGLYVLR